MSNNQKKILSYSLITFVIITLINYGISPYYQIGFNTTDSLDGFIYLIKKGEMPMRGDVAAFFPPLPNKTRTRLPFLKIVKGVPGDRIKSIDSSLYINNKFVARAKEFSKKGDRLNVIELDKGFIRPKHFFLWSPHKDSYDSRYKDIGLVQKNKIIGVATRLL